MPEGTIFQDSSPTVENNSVPVAQASVVYPNKTNNSDQDVNKISSSRFNPKRLIKIAIFLLLILTTIFIIISIVLPRISSPKVKNVTLLYWGIQDELSVMAPIIADFEKENPNIKVEYSKQDLINYREKLSTRINNGNGPDIFKFHNTWLPMIKDDLLPLPQETIDKEQFMNDYYDVVQNDLVKNGAIYGLPLEMDTLVLYVNSAIFEQAEREREAKIKVPTTWQEFIDASTKLTKRDESGQIIISGAGIGTYDNVDHASDIISLLFAQNGIDINNLSDFPEKNFRCFAFLHNFFLNRGLSLELSSGSFTKLILSG
jgi:multiple sugar transport system substrate-binding protein